MRKASKYLLVVLLVVLSVTFSGCAVVSTDLATLMSPPKLTKEQQAIEKALSDALGGADYTLSYPHQGNYRSSFVQHTFDSSGTKIVFAFYNLSPKAKSGTHVMVLRQINGTWKKACDISGDGNEVEQLIFGNFDGKNADEFAIGWTSFTSTDLLLNVYSLNGRKYNHIYKDTYTEMLPVDMTGSARNDLLLLKLNNTEKKASAALVSSYTGTLKEVATTPLDGTATGYQGLYQTTVDGSPAVLIDTKKGESAIVTEMVLWKNNTLLSPLYDSTAQTAFPQTMREYPIGCEDIDGDGNYEIPEPTPFPGYKEGDESYADKVWNVHWYAWTNGSLQLKTSTVVNSVKSYFFILPSLWENGQNITVKRVDGESDWAFYEWDDTQKQTGKHLFDLVVRAEDKLGSDPMPSNAIKLAQSGGNVYFYQPSSEGPSSPLFLTGDQVKAQFRISN